MPLLNRRSNQPCLAILLSCLAAISLTLDLYARPLQDDRKPEIDETADVSQQLEDAVRIVRSCLESEPYQKVPNPEQVVDVLTRTIAGLPVPSVIVVDSSGRSSNTTIDVLKQLGYATNVVRSGREAFRAAVADDSILFVVTESFITRNRLSKHEPAVTTSALRYTLTDFQADHRTARIPIFVFDESDSIYTLDHFEFFDSRLRQFERVYPQVRIIPRLTNLDEWNVLLALEFGEAEGRAFDVAPLSTPDRERNRLRALQALDLISERRDPSATRYLHGRTEEVLRQTLTNRDLGPLTAKILGQLATQRAQRILADVILDERRPLAFGFTIDPATRLEAARRLPGAINETGLGLSDREILDLVEFSLEATDPVLRPELVRVVEVIEEALRESRDRVVGPIQAGKIVFPEL